MHFQNGLNWHLFIMHYFILIDENHQRYFQFHFHFVLHWTRNQINKMWPEYNHDYHIIFDSTYALLSLVRSCAQCWHEDIPNILRNFCVSFCVVFPPLIITKWTKHHKARKHDSSRSNSSSSSSSNIRETMEPDKKKCIDVTDCIPTHRMNITCTAKRNAHITNRKKNIVSNRVRLQ